MVGVLWRRSLCIDCRPAPFCEYYDEVMDKMTGAVKGNAGARLGMLK